VSKRPITICIAIAVCVACVWGVSVQRNELLRLKDEQERIIARSDSAQSRAPASDSSIHGESLMHTDEVSEELLKLRAEVTALTRRRSELAGVEREKEQLSAQLQQVRTNTAAGIPLSPGYIRRAQAQMVGFNTPEDTLQTFLWAINHRDMPALQQAFVPADAEEFTKMVDSGKDFFKDAQSLPGIRVVSREQQPNGDVAIQAEFIPGVPPQTMLFSLVNGQWKMHK
jgi:hypothetical protein